jgi:hypothetical protein
MNTRVFDNRSGSIRRMSALLLAVASAVQFAPAIALPSFAQQTGLPCMQCHVQSYGPALTTYGRQFKLNAYNLGTSNPALPLALMVQGGYTRTNADQPEIPAPHYSVNNNASLDQVSVFYAARLASNFGAFVQVTYSGIDRTVSWDNLDIRYARTLKWGNNSLVTGLTVSNNPTVQDLWNSTPAWGFPWIASTLAPTPAADALISRLGQTVLGASVYAMLNNRFYLEAGGYRDLSNRWLKNFGLHASDNPNINGVSPYWRAVMQFVETHDYYSVGIFGIESRLQPDPSVPATDRYVDFGVDGTYQYPGSGPHAVSANASFIHEHRRLDASFANGASDAASNELHTLRADVSYTFQHTWNATAAGFDIRGTTNSGLYEPAPLSGSNDSSPNSRGYILQLEYVPFGKKDSIGRPWINFRVGVEYTGYTKFNGAATNYDGFGRDASQNNTLFTYFWAAF